MVDRLDVDAAVVGGDVVAPASLLIDDGVIIAVGSPADIGEVIADRVLLAGTIVPGFVDLQVNGFAGFQYGSEGATTATIGALLLASGVTAHCPTVTTRPWEDYAADLGRVRSTGESDRMPRPASRDLGLHLEGPFLSPSHAGAHDRTALIAPTAPHLEVLLAMAGATAIVTIAAELPGGMEAVARLVDNDVVVSLGHTGATYDQVREAVANGASMVTHVFNAQRGLGHRDPGTAGAALLLDGLRFGIILDGHHVHPDLAERVLEMAPDRAFAVTDAVATAGLARGLHHIAGVTVDTSDGAPRLADGTLAGSNLTMDEAFRFVSSRLGLPAAVRATATVPAAAVGRDDLGEIRPGARADLVLLDDTQHVAAVWLDGVRVTT